MKLKKILSGLFTIFIITVIVIVAYFNRPFINRQLDKIKGMYYVHLGDKAYKVYNIKDAILFYNKGLNLYPKHYGAWHNLGNIYVAYEDYYSALDAYTHAYKLNPKMMIARMNYGIVSSELLGDFDSAIKQYKEVVKTKRRLVSIPYIYDNTLSYKENRAIAYYNMGVTYRMKALYSSDDWEKQRHYMSEAIKNYQKSIEIYPDSYDAQYNLGTLYHITGDYDRAGRCYCKAINLEPTHYEAHYNLSILLKRLGYYNEAYDEINKAVTLITALNENSAMLEYITTVMGELSRDVYQNEDYKKYLANSAAKFARNANSEQKTKGFKKNKKIKREYGQTISADGANIIVNSKTSDSENISKDFGNCPSFKYFSPEIDEF